MGLKRSLVILLAALLALGLIEAQARRWMTEGNLMTREQFFASRPAAYADSTYYSPAFLAEQKALSKTIIADDSGSHIAYDVHGQWINADGGNRRTVGQPEHWSHTLWVFGLSTILSAEVPDKYTIPSQLQNLMPQYRVINRGMWGGSLALQLARLKETPITPGDTVIVYGGTNEIQDVYYAAIRARPGWCATMYITAALCRLSTNYNGEAEAGRLLKTVRQIAEYVRARGAGFLFVLQPHLFSKSLSTYEQHLTTLIALVPPDLDRAFGATWPAFQSVTQAVGGIDLTHALDELRSQCDVYLDFSHVTERGNEIIAHAIFDYLSIF